SVPSGYLPFSQGPIQLGVLGASGAQNMRHADGAACGGSNEACMQGDIADVAAGNIQLSQAIEIEPAAGHLHGKDRLPDTSAFFEIRKREIDHEAEASQKSRVNGALEIRGQDRESTVGLHPLEKIAYLDVGIAIVTVADLSALAEDGIGFIEQQHYAAPLGRIEHAP